ncbi:Serine/threonine-protein kinase sid2 [Smittium mucronatum]|uniref:non-specific serine/threonine protein kinase n=1 Tax=Smittium mucronatum TaxID=133383 RepID=A0A1R0GTA5_9FUNG|nr:Serine/threonine-protein kinase sid2 [Smittium mucronatum]
MFSRNQNPSENTQPGQDPFSNWPSDPRIPSTPQPIQNSQSIECDPSPPHLNSPGTDMDLDISKTVNKHTFSRAQASQNPQPSDQMEVETLSYKNYVANQHLQPPLPLQFSKNDSPLQNPSSNIPILPESSIVNQQRFIPHHHIRRGLLGLPSEAQDNAYPISDKIPPPSGSITQRNALLLTLDPQIRRKIEAAHVYFLDYYYDHLLYIYNRQNRTRDFKTTLKSYQLPRAHLEHAWKNFTSNESAILRKRRVRTREHEFDIFAQIGQGGYGKVFLARKRDTNEVCALKKMSKKLLFKLNEVQHILTERDILRTGNSPWLVKLLYAFQDPENVFLAMEYIAGGDVRTLLNSNGILLNKHIKFYSAEMFVSVAALHTLGFVHRDLKPENFMIDSQGHIKLTDFGLSQGQLSRQRLKIMKDRLEKIKDEDINYYTSSEKRSFYRYWRRDEMPQAYSIVGSPDYMAPEILYTSINMSKMNNESNSSNNDASGSNNDPTSLKPSKDPDSENKDIGYDHRVDYWSLGCILYEFGAGYAPFTGQSSDDVWRNVYHWEKYFSKPEFDSLEAQKNFTDDMWDLITKLICHRDRRLCTLQEAQNHPFYAGYDLAYMRDKAEPPFIPELENEIDTSYFDDFTNNQNLDLYREVIKKQNEVDGLLKESEVEDAANNSSVSSNDEILIKNNAFAGFTYRHNKLNRYL